MDDTLRLSRGVLYAQDGPIKVKRIGKGAFSVAMASLDVNDRRRPVVRCGGVACFGMHRLRSDRRPTMTYFVPRTAAYGSLTAVVRAAQSRTMP